MKDYLVKFYDQDYMLLVDIIKVESLEDLKVSVDSKVKILMDENGVNEIIWIVSEVVFEGKVMEQEYKFNQRRKDYDKVRRNYFNGSIFKRCEG